MKSLVNIGIKHGFSCINVCQVPREVLKTSAFGLAFQHLPRDLANVNHGGESGGLNDRVTEFRAGFRTKQVKILTISFLKG